MGQVRTIYLILCPNLNHDFGNKAYCDRAFHAITLCFLPMPRTKYARTAFSPYTRARRSLFQGPRKIRRIRDRRDDDDRALTLAIARADGATGSAIPNLVLSSRGFQQNLHYFARWADTRGGEFPSRQFISCNFPASGWNAIGLNFQFQNVSHSTELRSLYDAYRIDKIELWFDYTPDAGTDPQSNTVFGAGAFSPKLWLKRDYNDSNAADLDDMEQSNQSQVIRFDAGRNTVGPYFLKPAIAQEVFQDPSAGVATSTAWRQWIRTAHASVPHYGCKLVAQGAPGANLGQITIRTRYHFAMKNVR